MPSAWPLDAYASTLVARLHACKPSEVGPVLKRYAADHRDPAWIVRTADALCVPALAIVEALAMRGGMLHSTELDEIVRRDFGVDPASVTAGLRQLFRDLLVVPLESPRGSAFALVAPAADRIAAHVAGLAARAPAASGPTRDDGRTLVAVTAMFAQVDLKLTRDGRPHRAGIKRIAKQTGLDEKRLERAVIVAWRLGLLGELEDATVRPLAEPLLAAAHGQYPKHRVVARLAERINALGAVSVTALDGWMETCAYRQIMTFSVDDLAWLPGLGARGERDGRAEAVVAVPLPTAAAGTVAPNFEVFLPPEARLSDVARVLSACEPVRIDRMIVGRITKSSIARATAAGATCDELLALFGQASRSPIPQNVAAALRDWTSSSTYARVFTGRVVVVPAADEARLIAALPPVAAARALAPGVIAISDQLPERAIAIALDKLGIVVRADEAPTRPRDLGDARDSGSELPALLTAPEPLRARVAAFRAGDPIERERVRAIAPVPVPPTTATTSPPKQPAIASRDGRWQRAEPDDDDDDGLDRLDAELAMSPGTRRALEAYERRIGEELPGEAFHALAFAIEGLSSHDRRFVLAPATLDETRERLLKILAARSPAGPAARSAFAELARMLGATALGPAPGKLEWHRTGVHARLEAAARTHSTLLLDIGGGEPRQVAITRLTMRGTTLFVLGEDPHGNGVAMPYARIHAVAEPPPISGASETARWTPLTGMTPPPGHEPCPCGSGKRYRQCCRTTS